MIPNQTIDQSSLLLLSCGACHLAHRAVASTLSGHTEMKSSWEVSHISLMVVVMMMMMTANIY